MTAWGQLNYCVTPNTRTRADAQLQVNANQLLAIWQGATLERAIRESGIRRYLNNWIVPHLGQGTNFQCSAVIAKVLREEIDSTISSVVTMALA